MFGSHLAKEGLALSSIKLYLSAVRNLHVEAGLHSVWEEQLTPRLQLVLKGIKRAIATGLPTPARLPITFEIMRQIKAVLLRDPQKYDNILLGAACCLVFFGFLRCGEFTVPSQTDYDKGAHSLVPGQIFATQKRNGTKRRKLGLVHTARVISARRRSIFRVIILFIRT